MINEAKQLNKKILKMDRLKTKLQFMCNRLDDIYHKSLDEGLLGSASGSFNCSLHELDDAIESLINQIDDLQKEQKALQGK